MRKLATIRKVDEIRPIVEADAIELAVFGGWQVVVRRAQEIRPGMLVVYCEIDSVFPEQPQYEFLRQELGVSRDPRADLLETCRTI